MSTVEHPLQWRAPSPAWPSLPATPANVSTLLRPAVLRFASDTFMADLSRLLDTRPRELPSVVAKPVTFRLAGPGPKSDPPPKLDKLKLYQPAHGDFYLVAASLICAIPGMPDRTVDAAAGDRVSFVLRRLAGTTELAWVDDPLSATGRSWLALADQARGALAAGEERLPMFPVNFTDADERRRLLVGYIPTASKESFVASALVDPQPMAPADGRLEDLDARVIGPLTDLRARSGKAGEPERVDSSRFLLLDLAQLLSDGAPAIWQALSSGVTPPPGPARLLFEALTSKQADPAVPITWRSALLAAWSQRRDIGGESGVKPALKLDLAATPVLPADLRKLVADALPPKPAGAKPSVAPLPVPKLDPRGEARYVLRCAYERPQCEGVHPPTVSAPTEDFSIASFYDFDAPVRDIQITLPADTSMKDLRKFQRNVRFIISDELRQQMSRVSPLGKMSDGELAPGEGLSLGWICSFSLPIIMICALLVLYIFLALLNIIFWWLPFVRVCLPIPLKGK